MAETFKAWVISEAESGQSVAFTDFPETDLMEGDVTVRIIHSGINYKDGLALTGKAPIAKRFPLIPGIDFAGEVVASEHADYAVGDGVILCGWGVGESHHGGLAETARVKGEWLVPLPGSMSPADAMAIGTAGYTAMLCVMALEEHGLKPGDGDVLVTGAAGGVGSVAVAVLSKLGHTVVASTGRVEETDYLTSLGASEVIGRETFSGKLRPLAKSRWVGAVDVAGSETLAHVLTQMAYGSSVAACGLAQGMDLPTSVAPFILRAVNLLGVESVNCPRERRLEAWRRLEQDLDMAKLAQMTKHVPLAEVMPVAEQIVEGKVRGRVVVDVAV